MAAAMGVFCLRNDIDAFGTVVSGWALGMGHSRPGPAETRVRGKWVFLLCTDSDGDNKIPGLRPFVFFFFFFLSIHVCNRNWPRAMKLLTLPPMEH